MITDDLRSPQSAPSGQVEQKPVDKPLSCTKLLIMGCFKFFFLHNPKAGGSSIRSAIASVSGTIAPVFNNAPAESRKSRRAMADLVEYDFYAGHYGYDVYDRLQNGHALITNFRDPVQRIYSLYRYWRYNVPAETMGDLDPLDAQIVAIAKEATFSEFIRADNPDLKLYIRNFHFRQILRSGWEWAKAGWPEFWLVKWRIRHMPWFFIAETPDVSCLLLRRLIPRLDGITIPRLNQSLGGITDIAPDDVKALTDMNKLDYAIYAYALRLQTKRLQQRRTHPNLRGV